MKYHLIGDMGVSMRGIKKILENEGHTVTGSDLKSGGHSAQNISEDINMVVRTSAVSPGSEGWVEVKAAKKLGIPVVKRSKFLGELTKDKYLITVSGMHGKTTVTSLIGLAMEKAGFDPTVLVGEDVSEFDGVFRIGESKYFVLEACEYDKSFLDFKPNMAVVTNLDLEHLDTFLAGWSDIEKAFKSFFENIKEGGKLIYFEDDERLKKVVSESKKDIEKKVYNTSDARGIETSLLGEHNKSNIAAAISVMNALGVEQEKYSEVFKTFKGASRRLEFKGEVNGMKVYDDYGHHPTEIKATIEALKNEYPEKKLLTVFWPHQYKRIEPLKDEFTKSLNISDKVILKPIFFVPGRDERRDVSSEDIALGINKENEKAKVFEDDEQIVKEILENYNNDWIALTIGIPPIYKIADKLIEANN